MYQINKLYERSKLINVSIRTKLLLIYLFCILIPTIIFCYTIYSSLLQSASKEKLILYKQSVERIRSAIEVNAISAIELSNIMNLGAVAAQQGTHSTMLTPMSIRSAITIVAALPVLFVCPFLQKYFVAGLHVGGVNG